MEQTDGAKAVKRLHAEAPTGSGVGALVSSTRMLTVVGYYPDTRQRFAESYEARNWREAEAMAVDANPGLVPVATFAGQRSPVDRAQYVGCDRG